MRYDSDLEFLKKCTDKELNNLECIITKDTDGKPRRNSSLNTDDIYKEHYPKHSKYCSELLRELQEFGGNSMVNLVRGGGVTYREILEDACSDESIKDYKQLSTLELEEKFSIKLLGKMFNHLTDEQKNEELKNLNISKTDFAEQGIWAIAKVAISISGKQIASKQVGFLLGPFGWGFNGAWMAYDVSGPAYRVTKPAILEIYILRKRAEANKTIIGKVKKMFRFVL